MVSGRVSVSGWCTRLLDGETKYFVIEITTERGRFRGDHQAVSEEEITMRFHFSSLYTGTIATIGKPTFFLHFILEL